MLQGPGSPLSIASWKGDRDAKMYSTETMFPLRSRSKTRVNKYTAQIKVGNKYYRKIMSGRV